MLRRNGEFRAPVLFGPFVHYPRISRIDQDVPRFVSCALIAVLMLAPRFAAAEETLAFHGGTMIEFASIERAAQILGKSDRYSSALSRFDLQARLKTNQEVTERDFLAFAALQASDWPPEDVARVRAALARLLPKMADLAPIFPAKVWIVQTTGQEEGDAAYCRGPAIVLPHRHVRRDDVDLERLLAHELFHVASSQDAELRARLYAVIGFEMCDPVEVPASLAGRKLTNPDGPLLDCTIAIEHEGRPLSLAPLLYASAENYDATRGGTIFDYLTFRLLEVEPAPGAEGGATWRAVERDGRPSLYDPAKLTDFHRKIGRNTEYIIHPDEILADNFSLLVLKSEKLPSPEIVAKMREILAR
jgi:hypothetical protein